MWSYFSCFPKQINFRSLLASHTPKIEDCITSLHVLIQTGQVWLNHSMFIYELSGCGFESRCNCLTSLTDIA